MIGTLFEGVMFGIYVICSLYLILGLCKAGAK